MSLSLFYIVCFDKAVLSTYTTVACFSPIPWSFCHFMLSHNLHELHRYHLIILNVFMIKVQVRRHVVIYTNTSPLMIIFNASEFSVRISAYKTIKTDNRPVVAKRWVLGEGLTADGHETTFCSTFIVVLVKLQYMTIKTYRTIY